MEKKGGCVGEKRGRWAAMKIFFYIFIFFLLL